MRNILYLSLSVNGRVFQPDRAHPIPPSVLKNFREKVEEVGNLVNGRRTYELAHAGGAIAGLGDIAYVVVGHVAAPSEPNVRVAPTPEAALDHLRKRNFSAALIGGGASLDAAYISQGLIQELYVNIIPVLMPDGPIIPGIQDLRVSLDLLGQTTLAEGIVQMHYKVVG